MAQRTVRRALSLCSVTAIAFLYTSTVKSQPSGGIAVVTTIKKLDQQRHELKALRYLPEYFPESTRNCGALPSREDFQIPDNRRIYDALMSTKTKDEAAKAIEELELEETDIESFLRLGGQFYHTYPQLVKERGEEFRAGEIKIVTPGE